MEPTRDYIERCQREMEAYDALPAGLRKLLQQSTYSHSVLNLKRVIAEGGSIEGIAKMILL